MQIVCPKCATSYEVGATTIGTSGRAVRCVRCRNILQVTSPATANDAAVATFQQELGSTAPAAGEAVPPAAPPPERPLSVEQALANASAHSPPPDIETAAAAASLADHPVDLDAAAPPAAEPVAIADAPPLVPAASGPEPAADFEPPRRRRPARRPPPKPAFDRRMAAVIAGLLVIVGALIWLRTEIVRHAPQMASLYSAIGMPVNLRKLVFAEVQLARETHDGVPLLLVEGTIVSTSSTPIDVPRLRFAIRNAAGAEIYSWATQPPQAKLPPFEAMTFRGQLASPPPDGRAVVVRFYNRRDAIN